MSTELRRLGKYELRERLATGGQGEVWKAFDVQLRRFVAIKQLNAHLQTDLDSTERFEREARFIASLRHSNIVRIHDFLHLPGSPGSHTSTAYMVMDYIDGPTLADYIRNTSRKRQYPSASDVVTIFTAISLALDYAHQKGMVHRDIKPANIMLDKRNPHAKPMGEPVLMDFGIAKLQSGAAETTKVLGTPLYVSPEQAQGLSGDRRSDLYSLGIILYEVMTGRPPFLGESIPAILLRHHQEIPQSPDLINPDITPEVSAVILKSLSKDPDARYSSASAMTRALAEALNVPVPPELGMSPTILSQAPTQLSENASPLAFVPSPDDKQTPVSPLPSGKRSKKKLSIALILFLAMLVLGSASYALFASLSGGGKPGASTVVGHLVFRSSQHKAGDFDVADITDLKSIPDDSQDGKNYHAWLEVHDFSGESGIHWSFTVRNGSISPPSYQQQDLLKPLPYLFLITRQGGNVVVPSFSLTDRLYYARITQVDNKHSTFNIMKCPQSDDSSNPCRD
jgi:serine/threonine-protein kinase